MFSCCTSRSDGLFKASGVSCPYMVDQDERIEFEKRVRNICIPDHPDREALEKQLKCYFEASDENNDEEIQREEFDTLIEYTAEEPRRNGFVPSLATMFQGDLKKVKKHRDDLFEEMKGEGEKIDFEAYKDWTFKHIAKKVLKMKVTPASQTQNEATEFVSKLKKAQMWGTWDSALKPYKDMFMNCGVNVQGKNEKGIAKEQWGILIEVFAETPRIMGLVPKMTDTYKSSEEMRTERNLLFDKITNNQDMMTYTDFKAWLIAHLKEKLKQHK